MNLTYIHHESCTYSFVGGQCLLEGWCSLGPSISIERSFSSFSRSAAVTLHPLSGVEISPQWLVIVLCFRKKNFYYVSQNNFSVRCNKYYHTGFVTFILIGCRNKIYYFYVTYLSIYLPIMLNPYWPNLHYTVANLNDITLSY